MIAAVMGWSWHSDRSQVRPDGDVLNGSPVTSDATRTRCTLIASETARHQLGVFVSAHMASDLVGGQPLWKYGRPASLASDATKGHQAIRASKVNP